MEGRSSNVVLNPCLYDHWTPETLGSPWSWPFILSHPLLGISLMFSIVVIVTTIAAWAGHNPLTAGDMRYSFAQYNSPVLYQLESGSRESKHLFFLQRIIPNPPKISLCSYKTKSKCYQGQREKYWIHTLWLTLVFLLKVWVASGQPGSITEKTKVISLTLKFDQVVPNPLFIGCTLGFHTSHSIWVQDKGT